MAKILEKIEVKVSGCNKPGKVKVEFTIPAANVRRVIKGAINSDLGVNSGVFPNFQVGDLVVDMELSVEEAKELIEKAV